VRVIICPIDIKTIENESYMFVSKLSTLHELKDRVIKILQNYYRNQYISYHPSNLKIWKVEMNEENVDILKKFANDSNKEFLKLNAELLDDQIMKIEVF
jgi:hypothetical protein